MNVSIFDASRTIALTLIVLGAIAFGNPREDSGPDRVGSKPAGARAYVLTGPTLDSKTVTVNGLSVDTTSVESVRASIARVFASGQPDETAIADSGSRKVDFEIDYTASGIEIPDVYYGVNIQIASKDYFAMPLYRELVRHLRIDIARFPAGQERVKYDRDAAPDSRWRLGGGSEYEFLLTGKDVENFISLCRENGIKAEPEINLTNEDPAMWARMADQIVNALKYPLEYVSVGNELDINPTGNWSHLGAKNRDAAIDEYAARYARYRSAIQAIAPKASFVLGELACNRDPDLTAILRRMLAGAKAFPPEAVSAHWYLLGDWGEPKTHPEYPSVEHLSVDGNDGNNVRRLKAIRDSLKASTRSSDKETKIFIGEWGASWSATQNGTDVLDTLATALYTAEVLEYGKTVGVDSMEYFSLSDPASFSPWNSAMIAMDGERATVRPQYYVRMMHNYAWGTRTIPVPGGQSEEFSVYASKDGDDAYLMLINRTERTLERLVAVKTARGVGRYRMVMVPRSVTIVVLP